MTVFSKPPLSISEHISQWTSRGLLIPDPARTRRYLSVISYYRLSAYTLPFQVGDSGHHFRLFNLEYLPSERLEDREPDDLTSSSQKDENRSSGSGSRGPSRASVPPKSSRGALGVDHIMRVFINKNKEFILSGFFI